jgi:hypothetical protein
MKTNATIKQEQRIRRLDVIVRCLQAFDDCYYGRDVDRAEQDLQAARNSKPEKFILTALRARA